METVYIIVTVLQVLVVGLGVGSSTNAAAQFFIAIADGQIDATERKMLGVTYTLLRVAMGIILLATAAQAGILYSFIGMQYLNPFSVGIWSIIAILILNAIGMWKHWIPSAFGPGIQVGSWYTLGIIFALVPLGKTSYTYLQFGLGYAGMIMLAIAVMNGVMAYQKNK